MTATNTTLTGTAPHTVWRFSQPATWARVSDPVHCPPGGDWEEAVRGAGYWRSFDLGVEHSSSLWCAIHEQEDGEGFLVEVNTAARSYTVVCPALPDLLGLLDKLAPLTARCAASDKAQAEHERQAEERAQRRQRETVRRADR